MKITLTAAQVQEIKGKALARQQEAEKAFNTARAAYNKVMYLGSGEIELSRLIELTDGLETGGAVQPATPPQPLGTLKRYFAYSRTGRKEGDSTAVHDIGLNVLDGKVVTKSCTCPGFKNHGYCWASSEAKLQAENTTGSRRSGSNGVYVRM